MTPGQDIRVYASRRRQLVLVAALLGIFAVSVSSVVERDPTTGLQPLPGDYLWMVIPGAILVAVLVRRALKARIVTDRSGIDVVRVVGHEFLPWSDIRRFEVHPTPTRQGFAVVARRHDELVVKISSQVTAWPPRDRDQARRTARRWADELRDRLEGDRHERAQASATAGATPGPDPSSPAGG